ncbi:hypothetical protein HanHA89_Chr13g0497791 [Helianthus annuus]|nr:hypothetical protein HanHA89_Chr13g0497791 [Helianthus annuus]
MTFRDIRAVTREVSSFPTSVEMVCPYKALVEVLLFTLPAQSSFLNRYLFLYGTQFIIYELFRRVRPLLPGSRVGSSS